jgi:hypothetical protein
MPSASGLWRQRNREDFNSKEAGAPSMERYRSVVAYQTSSHGSRTMPSLSTLWPSLACHELLKNQVEMMIAVRNATFYSVKQLLIQIAEHHTKAILFFTRKSVKGLKLDQIYI